MRISDWSSDVCSSDLPPVSEGHSIASQVADSARVRGSLPTVIEGDYFRVRVFKNGNLHIWFERDDLLQSVNLVLAEYYGEAIGDGYETNEAERSEEHTAEIQSLMRKQYAVVGWKKKKKK